MPLVFESFEEEFNKPYIIDAERRQELLDFCTDIVVANLN